MTLSGAELAERDSPLWFCLKTQPKREHLAAASIQQLPGVEVFSPRIRYRKATRRGPVWFVEALFPGYIMAQFVFTTLHRQIHYLPGVCNVVHFGEKFGVLEASVVEQLKAVWGAEVDRF